VKIRSTWHEPVYLTLNGAPVRVNPGDVVEVPESCADLLEQRGGKLFALVTPPKKGDV